MGYVLGAATVTLMNCLIKHCAIGISCNTGSKLIMYNTTISHCIKAIQSNEADVEINFNASCIRNSLHYGLVLICEENTADATKLGNKQIYQDIIDIER